MNGKKSLIFFLIISLIAVISLTTYAISFWRSNENTELTVSIGELLDVSFENGNDIATTEMAPVLEPEKYGEIINFSVYNKTENKFLTNFKLDNVTFSENLNNEEFKYKILSSVDDVTYEEIALDTVNNFVNNGFSTPITSGRTYYKLILYIDGTVENSPEMMNQTFNAILNVDVSLPTFADHIMSLANVDDSGVTYYANGDYSIKAIVDIDTYRYAGSNVDNYVKFNNDLYRIIGVDSRNQHGRDGMLVKLVSANFLGASALVKDLFFDGNEGQVFEGTNNFSEGSLNILLNEYFYTKNSVSSVYGNCKHWTHFSSSVETAALTNSCSNVLGFGLSNESSAYIEEVSWGLAGGSVEPNRVEMMGWEEQCIIYSDPDGNWPMDWDNVSYGRFETKIGLMHSSDYLFASSAIDNDDNIIDNPLISSENWLYKGNEWFISPAENGKVLSVQDGILKANDPGLALNYRPAFYLKSDVLLLSGDGSFDNPYVLTMK